MAVELRCPDCRAKLRLKAAPEAGTEVECPKCGTVFPAPEPEPEADDDAPKKKKKAADGDGDEPKKGKKTRAKKGAKGDGPNVPRKRKAKKRETSKVALIAVICAGVVLLVCMAGVLVWYFSRTSKAVEMFYYVPEDAQVAMGINLGHAQKYPEFYKSLASLQTGTDFKLAGDAVAKAAGTDMDALVDYVAKAESVKNGSAIVFRTKAEFDGAALAKIPGAEKKTLDGKTYYVAPNLLPGGASGRVFAPTNRLVVVCSADATKTNDATFKKMLNGHADSKEKTLGVRMGDLGKRVTRGTFWQMTLFEGEVKTDSVLPAADGAANADDNKAKKRSFFSDALNGTKGIGVKASLGSREIRFEMVAWHKDAEKPSSFAKKMKEGELGKGDEGTPPRWFTSDTSALGDKKIAAQLISNIGFGSAGELFYAKSAVDTADLQTSASGVMGKVLGITSSNQGGMTPGGGGPGMPGGGGPGMPGGPPGPGAPPGGLPKLPRRRCHGPARSRR